MKKVTFTSNSMQDTAKIANFIAENIDKSFCIHLYGKVGAGKTAFSKFLIANLTKLTEDDIISPTFPIICSYDTFKGEEIFHLDLYRLKNEEELFELGIEDILQNHLCLVEWPQLIADYSYKNLIIINIHNHDNIRNIKISLPQHNENENLFNLLQDFKTIFTTNNIEND